MIAWCVGLTVAVVFLAATLVLSAGLIGNLSRRVRELEEKRGTFL